MAISQLLFHVLHKLQGLVQLLYNRGTSIQLNQKYIKYLVHHFYISTIFPFLSHLSVFTLEQ